MEYTLSMTFLTETNEKYSLSISGVKENITEETLSKIRALNAIAEERGQTLAQMALSWVYSKPGVTSVLIGASNPGQILDNIGMLGNTSFDEETYRKIDDIVLG